jgi:signal peptide peptidase SppA, 36K type
MDAETVIDRRRLRRKLGFWRAATFFVVAVAIGAAIWRAYPAGTSSDHIARITIDGVIRDDDDLIELIEKVTESERAKAAVITISSPGGTTYGGERIHKALVRLGEAKPVVADVRTLAASAGYMIAASTDHIVAGESSIVGSIGVIFQYPQIRQLLDTLGIRVDEIKSAPLKAEPSPFHDASPEAQEMIRKLVLDSYDWFVDLVAARRKMDRQKVLTLADGSIFTGRQGLANGLVDAIGGEAEIRAYLSGRGVAEGLEIVEWKPESNQTAGLIPRVAAFLFQRITGYDTTLGHEIERLGGGKLFLDGLVSVWQAGPTDPIKQ